MTKIDPVLLGLAKEVIRPGDVVWDIGANLGLFTFAAAATAGPAGRVIAVEPDPVLVTLLNRSATLNGALAPVEVLCVAASDSLDIARFNIARRARATSHLDGYGTTQTGGVRTTHSVPTVTLDWLAEHFPLPDVIKIDVEAAELKVLAGAGAVLRQSPRIICEVAGANAATVHKILDSHGYVLYDGDAPAGERHPAATAPPNTLAIPADR